MGAASRLHLLRCDHCCRSHHRQGKTSHSPMLLQHQLLHPGQHAVDLSGASNSCSKVCAFIGESEMPGMQGALALLDIETGVESLSEVEAGAAFIIMLFLTAAEPRRTV